MLIYRILSALIGIPIFLFTFWYGGLPLSTVIMILTVLGIFEMTRLWSRVNIRIWLPGAVIGGFLYIAAAQTGIRYLSGAALFFSLVIGAIYLLKVYPSFKFTDLSATLLTPLYAGWLLTHLISLRQLPGGFHYVLLVLASTWGTDTMAYFIGIIFGKRKLAPMVSPNKSVSGALGGIAGSITAALLVGLADKHMLIIHYLIIGLLVGVIGQAGDLVESAFKRMAGVKDAGRIIPGHGGVLDRFDSMFFTAPVTYYYLVLFIIN